MHTYHAAILNEGDDEYSIHCLNLPGLATQGRGIDETIENFKEAAKAIIESYRGCNELIHWKKEGSYKIPRGMEIIWLVF